MGRPTWIDWTEKAEQRGEDGPPEDYDGPEWYGEEEDQSWENAIKAAKKESERRALIRSRHQGGPVPISEAEHKGET
jgi:hypothetical protein|tara:strand:+ start:353 stop:583 length:231 start_codon:yes stop_codon:yes gene_type:complete